MLDHYATYHPLKYLEAIQEQHYARFKSNRKEEKLRNLLEGIPSRVA